MMLTSYDTSRAGAALLKWGGWSRLGVWRALRAMRGKFLTKLFLKGLGIAIMGSLRINTGCALVHADQCRKCTQ